MKKILITLMTVLSLMAFAACDSAEKENDSEESTIVSLEEVTTALTEKITEAEETTTTAETTTAAETEAEPAPVANGELFVGNGYTLLIDGEKWMDASEYIDEVAGMADGNEITETLNITSDDIANMADAMFFNIENGSNFNVTIAEVGDVGALNEEVLEQFASLMEQIYASMSGYICEGYEFIKVNGHDVIKFVIYTDDEVTGVELKMNTYLFYYGTKQFSMTYTDDKSTFDSTVADFNAVINSISFFEGATDEETTASTETTTSAETNTEPDGQMTSYTAGSCTFAYDSAKWTKESDEDVFNYIAGEGIYESATNFNIQQQDMGIEMDMTPDIMEMIASAIKEGYDSEGITFLDWSSVNINGYDVLMVNCEAEMMGMKFKMRQYCLVESGNQVIFTFTAYDDVFENAVPEFEEIINTVELN
ncbi:MAG: hypothetical protein J6K17_02040 [Oscillospiraceae bacterium]|nr:hypothetical protein [Oscillospiraceae bacterium]